MPLCEEILPLAHKCWQESTAFKGETCAYYGEREFSIEPDIDSYLRLESQGLLVLLTLRDEGILKGYVVSFLYKSIHHRKILCAIGDTIYIDPEYRGHTASLAGRLEKELKEMSVQIIGWPVHFQGPVYDFLKARGYVGDDIVMEKRL